MLFVHLCVHNDIHIDDMKEREKKKRDEKTYLLL